MFTKFTEKIQSNREIKRNTFNSSVKFIENPKSFSHSNIFMFSKSSSFYSLVFPFMFYCNKVACNFCFKCVLVSIEFHISLHYNYSDYTAETVQLDVIKKE